MNTKQQKLDAYIKTREKSVAGALVLALLLGPIGALYGSPLGGLILILLTLALAVSGMGAAAGVLGWLAAILVAPLAASDHNARVRAEAELLAGGAS